MARVTRFGIAVLAVGTVLAPAFADNVTVGQFYTALAQVKHLLSVDAVSAEANLRCAGFDLPQLALGKSLTEGDMAAISNALGIAVTTQRPAELISETQLNTYMSSFGSQLAAPARKVGDPPNNSAPTVNGSKGKKQGHHNSACEPH